MKSAAGLLLIVLLGTVSVSWQTPLSHFQAYMRKLTHRPLKESKCCTPSAFTYRSHRMESAVDDGEFESLNEFVRGAYDADNERESFEYVDDFSNGTEYKRKLIFDYKEGVSYHIENKDGTITCETEDLTEDFEQVCVPAESKYIGETTIGDHALTLATWIYDGAAQGEEEDILFTVQDLDDSECMYITARNRKFDPDTGITLTYTHTSFFDVILSIEDPDKWFTPPKECKTKPLMVETTNQRVTGIQAIIRKLIVL